MQRTVAKCLHSNNLQKGEAAFLECVSAHSSSPSLSLIHEVQKAVEEAGCGRPFVTALKACSHADDVLCGKLLHSHILGCGLEMDLYVENTLIHMYAKCGCLDDACRVFDRMHKHDLIGWNTVISGFAHHGQGWSALQFFGRMQQVDMAPNRITFVCVLKACSGIGSLEDGQIIHAYVVEGSMERNVSIGNSLIDMYAKCKSTQNAETVFRMLSEPDIVSWSTMMSCLCDQGHGEDALQFLVKMQRQGITPNHATYMSALKACSAILSLEKGMLIHVQIIEDGLEMVPSIGNTLIDMFAKCSSFKDAHTVLDNLPKRDVVTWTTMVANLASYGCERDALQIFERMQFEGLKPNQVTYLAVLKACSTLKALEYGRLIHAHIIEHGFGSLLVIGNTLLDMYAKCGSLCEARNMFDSLANRDAVSWSAMITGYANFERNQEALQLFKEMQAAGVRPNQITYVSILKLGSNMGNLKQGMLMHCHIVKHGLDMDLWVGNSLINMYSRCGNIECARQTFDTLPLRDVVTWSAMITGYAQVDQDKEALHLFNKMQQAGIKPNQITFVAILKACSSSTNVNEGRSVHSSIIKYGHESDVCVGNAVTNMYTVCTLLQDAKSVFEDLKTRDVVTWTVIIAGSAQNGHFEEALSLFYKMQQAGVKPNSATFISIFKACSIPGAASLGKAFHFHIVEGDFIFDISVANSLIHMYGKCGSLADAIAVFDTLSCQDVVSWSTLIAALSEHDLAVEALESYKEMLQYCLEPNHVTLLSILKACSSIGNLEHGQIIHAHACENGLNSDTSIANTLIDLYANCGTLVDAHRVFDRMVRRDVVTWSALIEGYAQWDCSQDALFFFGQMLLAGMMPNRVTLLSVLGACCSIVAVEQGKIIHGLVIELEFERNTNINSALLDMYIKSGSCQDAHRVFFDLPEQNEVAWSSMVAGYAQCNDFKMALQYFKGMQEQGFKPDDITFLSLLSACNHTGLMNEALCALTSMTEQGVYLSADHYNCIIDILGRTGNLEDAKVMLETLPSHLGVVGWTSLLGHSKTHGDLILGSHCFEGMLDVDNRNAAGYMLMSMAHAHDGRQEEADYVEYTRKHANAWTKPASASSEISTEALDFDVEDSDRTKSVDPYAKIQRPALQIQEKGHSSQGQGGQDRSSGCDNWCEEASRLQSEDEQYIQVSS